MTVHHLRNRHSASTSVSGSPTELANDFPGGERRLIQNPTGMRYILVNGGVTFETNECTGSLPGKLLRSYGMVG